MFTKNRLEVVSHYQSFFFITSAKEAMFLVWFICLIVGTIMKKNTEPFIMLLGGRVHHGPTRNPRHLNMNQNECTDNHFYVVKLQERAFGLGTVLHFKYFHPLSIPPAFHSVFLFSLSTDIIYCMMTSYPNSMAY